MTKYSTFPFKKKSLAFSLLGNFFQHYDQALYYFLVPFIAPLFFPNRDPMISLLYGYAGLVSGIFMKPLGAYIFGKISDQKGRQKALYLSLGGMSITTMAMGLLPTYALWGIFSSALFLLLRFMQYFFSAGETINSALYLLENTDKKKKSLSASSFNISSLLGILLASFLVSILSSNQLIYPYWRVLYCLGILTAIFARAIYRSYSRKNTATRSPSLATKDILQWNIKALLPLIFLSGFSYMCFSMPFIFINGFVPLITSFSASQVIYDNTYLLIIDILIVFIIGVFFRNLPLKKIMSACLLSLTILPIFLFMRLTHCSLLEIFLIKLTLVIIGATFCVCFFIWIEKQAPLGYRGRVLSVCYVIGSQLFGSSSNWFCLWLYKTTSLVIAPAIYIVCLSFVGWMVFVTTKQFLTTTKTAVSSIDNMPTTPDPLL